MEKAMYDIKEIMKRAWACVKKHGISLSKALKWSWAKAKDEMSKCVILIKSVILQNGATCDITLHADGVAEMTATLNGKSSFKRMNIDKMSNEQLAALGLN